MASTRTTRFAQVQSWTRCRLPIEKPLPCLIDKYREDVGGWRVSLSLLVAAPGYYDSICGRNINDPEEVLFITVWEDDASLEAFVASPAYAAYLQAFSIHDPASPGAFFTVKPSIGLHWIKGRVTIFTLSFAHPVSPEKRNILTLAQGLPVAVRIFPSPYSIRIQRAWVQEPQLFGDGQLVENGVAIQNWPGTLDVQIAMQEAVKDMWARENWQRQVERMNPLAVEEATWDMEIEVDEEDQDEEGDEVNEEDQDEEGDEVNKN